LWVECCTICGYNVVLQTASSDKWEWLLDLLLVNGYMVGGAHHLLTHLYSRVISSHKDLV
jgi:hypothetical protein